MHLPEGYLLQHGKYRLTHVVGQGGFGITYRGVWYTEVKGPLGTVATEVPVCVKEFFFKDYCYREIGTQAVKVHSDTGKVLFDKFKEKLIKEAKILSEVHHPYIVNVLEVFEENNTAYIAMEYISGNSLKSLLEREGILPEATVLRYVRQIGEALRFVHEKNILHLDIKPSNILIDQKGNARLIDFGVSKRYDIEQEETSTTLLTLSKGFASIEQYDSEGTQQFSPRPDIYSVGATMYNLLTGKIPTESILRATRPLPPPSSINPAITPRTEAVILKAMNVVPAERYATIAEMMAALDFSAVMGNEPENLGNEPQKTGNEPEKSGNEETTLVYKPTHSDYTGSEETIIDTPDPGREKTPVAQRKHRGKRMIPTGIAIFVLAGSATALWVHNLRPEEKSAERLALSPVEKVDSVAKRQPVTNVPTEERRQAPAHLPPKKETRPTEQPRERERQASVTSPPVREEKPEKPAAAETPTETEVSNRYQALLNSGKEKMAKADFTGAKRDLNAAKELRLTEEVVRLLIECDERAEQQQLVNRLAQYEEKMAFGNYKIVRKKSNNRYGAIDAKGVERIPCKYLSVGLSDKGRAFEREDNLFDIYSASGSLIDEGVTYY